MNFKLRKIEEKSNPFLKENLKPLSCRVFFGPEIIKLPRKRSIFSKNIFWLVVSFFILFYLILGLKNLFSPPEIIIYLPPDNYLTQERMITIKGRVEGNAVVAINNQPVTLKENRFEEKIALSKGVNFIKISARKKFSQEKVIFRRIIAK